MMPFSTRIHRFGAVALVALALLLSLLPTQRAFADHTPMPSSVTLVGSLQSELGCPGDWQPECADTHLTAVPGEPEVFRASFDGAGRRLRVQGCAQRFLGRELWGERRSWRGQHCPDGTRRGGDVHLRPSHPPGQRRHPQAPDRGQRRPMAAPRPIALDLPDDRAGFSYRLYWSADASLAREGDTVTGGTSAPLTVREGGLPAGLRKRFPQLADYEALVVPKTVRRQIATILTDQLAVASFRPDGSLATVTGVQLPGVLDDVYQGARTRTLGPVWRDGRPQPAVWAPTAQHVDVLMAPVGSATERRIAMRRDDDGVWSVRGGTGWRERPLPVRGDRLRADHPEGRDEPRHRPVLAGADHRLGALGAGRPGRCRAEAVRLEAAAQAAPAQAGDSDDLRVARAGLLDPRPDGSRRRTAARTWPSPTAAATGCGTCDSWPEAGLNTVHLLPVNDIASIEEDRAKQETPGLRPGVVPAGERAAAGLRHRGRREGRLQLGLRPAALHGTRGLLLDEPRRHGPQPRVPADGAGAQRRRAAGGDGRRLQPHPGLRPGPEVDPRPGRARLLPAAERHRPGRDLDLLLQHRDRARR